VIRWIKRLLSPESPQDHPAIAGDFHRRLHLAKLQLAESARQDGPAGRSSDPLNQPPPPFEITPERSWKGSIQHEKFKASIPDEGSLAVALEDILQGGRVGNEVFLKLYRHGFVFKEKEKKWGITEAGKSLIERYKILSAQECRVGELKCGKGWS
jgi:hypothetical protein